MRQDFKDILVSHMMKPHPITGHTFTITTINEMFERDEAFVPMMEAMLEDIYKAGVKDAKEFVNHPAIIRAVNKEGAGSSLATLFNKLK